MNQVLNILYLNLGIKRDNWQLLYIFLRQHRRRLPTCQKRPPSIHFSVSRVFPSALLSKFWAQRAEACRKGTFHARSRSSIRSILKVRIFGIEKRKPPEIRPEHGVSGLYLCRPHALKKCAKRACLGGHVCAKSRYLRRFEGTTQQQTTATTQQHIQITYSYMHCFFS